MSEQKKPQAGEYWRTRGGERRYVAAVLPEELDLNFRVISIAYDGATETHLIDGMTDGGSIEWPEDLVEHLPWCTSFDDPEPVAEVWPKWYVPRDRSCVAAVCRTSDVRANVYDGKGCDVNIPMRVDTHHWLEVTEAEALARLHPHTPTCPDCGEPLTPGHADVCPMAWVVQDRVPYRVGDFVRWSDWKENEWHMVNELSRPVLTHGDSDSQGTATISVRCRRRDLPPLPSPEPSTPDPGEGFVWVAMGDNLRPGDQWKDQQGTWRNAICVGGTVLESHWYRRRITLDPGSDAFIVLSDADVILNSDERDYVKNGSHENEWSSISFALPWSVGKTVRQLKNDERVKRYGNIVIRRRITPAPQCTCPEPGVVAIDCPTDGLGHGFSETDTVPIQFMVPRRVLDGGDWPVRACLAGGLVEDAATWIPVMIDRLGNTSVRKAVNQ